MPVTSPSDNDRTNTESSLVWGTSTFEPGYDVGLVAQLTIGLIERDNPSTRARLWSLVSDDAPLDDILDELSSTGLKALPDFGLAQVEGDAVRIVARGRATITAELTSGESHSIDPSGVRTWIEEVVADVAGLTITLAPLDDDSDVPLSSEAFAVLAGSVPARSLSRRFDVADPHADGVGADWKAAGAVADDAAVVAAASATALDPEPDVEPEPGGAAADEASDGDSRFGDGTAAPESEVVPPQPADPQPSGPPPADAQPASPQPSGPPPADAQPASPQPSGPPPSAPGGGAAPPEPTVVVGSADGPASGPASSIFDDDAIVPVLPPDESAGMARSDDGGAGLGDTAAPVLGVLAFSNGERINVDRAVLIGRNPKVAGAVEGGLPHIMKFDGPGQGLSRTHAEVRAEAGEMVLEDLQSTNGTEIQLPGQQRRRLRGGEPVVVVPGTLIDFGDELHCTVETAG